MRIHGLDDGSGTTPIDVTYFRGTELKAVTLTAKWWMKPICWILGRPTTIKRYRRVATSDPPRHNPPQT